MTFRKFILSLTVIGSVASVISVLIIFIPNREEITLEVQTMEREMLTDGSNQKEPDLKVSYKFKNEPISNLWKYKISFINNSEKTIIGSGNQKSIIQDRLKFLAKSDSKILDAKLSASDLKHTLEYDDHTIYLSFHQWRPSESITYSFYIKSYAANPDNLLFDEPDFRQIVDGNITFKVQENKPEETDGRITKKIPHQVQKAAYVISLIFTGIIILGFTIFIIILPFSHSKAKRWYRDNYESFELFVDQTYTSELLRTKYINNPQKLPDYNWDNFSGEKFPDLSVEMNIQRVPNFIAALVFFVLLNFSLLVTFIDLIYQFP